MKSNKALEKIKMLVNNLKTLVKEVFVKSSRVGSEKPPKTLGLDIRRPHLLAYRLIGEKTERALPLFRDLDSNLQRSGLKVTFKAYVSLTLFATILASVATLVSVPSLLFFAFKLPLLSAILFGAGGSLFAFAFSIIGFYAYPIYRSDKLRRELEDELPFTTGYMAILTSAGVSPEKIFSSLSNLSVPLTVSMEAKDIVRDVNLFGLDIISALDNASSRTSSERFREMLEGFISTIHSGSDLAAYLRGKSREYMKLKRINLKKFSDSLSMLSEFYVALLITAPLLFVIMLAVMAMLGGGTLGPLGPDILLQMLTYLGIPLGSIVFLIILDAVSPKW
jgi:flagellar protein FlaJ